MKFLVLGQGGREHAIVKALSQSPSVTQVHVSPGNPGMSNLAIVHQLDLKNSENLIALCLRLEIDCVIVGPENYLVAGVSDRLRERGIIVFGPSQAAAQLEGSKIFAKEFMKRAQIPTSHFAVVQSVEEVQQHITHFTPPYVLKADGLASGKGVFICKTADELFQCADDLFNKKTLGEAGKSALLEQFQPGWEMSYLVLTNGQSYEVLPVAQDHKRLLDGNNGPNTGGMGTFAPLEISESLRKKINETVVAPTVQLLQQDSLLYRGVIFIGLMIDQNNQPWVLEYNVRFGDPETQVILPLIENDLGHVFYEISCGRLPKIKQRQLHACCVVMAAEGYPDHPVKGAAISGNTIESHNNSYFLHAGTNLIEGQWQTYGGRVLNAVGLGSTPKAAINEAYELSQKVNWHGLQKRSDIGSQVLFEKK